MRKIFTLLLLVLLVSCGTKKKAVHEDLAIKDTVSSSSSGKTENISKQVALKDSTGSVKQRESECDYFKAKPIDPTKPSAVIVNGKKLEFQNATVEYGKNKTSEKEESTEVKHAATLETKNLKEDQSKFNQGSVAKYDLVATEDKDNSAVGKNIKSTVIWIVIFFFVLLIIIYYIRNRLISRPADDHTFL